MPPLCGCLDPSERWHHGVQQHAELQPSYHLAVPGAIEEGTEPDQNEAWQLEEPARRAAQWIRYDDRIQKLCDSINKQTNVIIVLKKVANVC